MQSMDRRTFLWGILMSLAWPAGARAQRAASEFTPTAIRQRLEASVQLQRQALESLGDSGKAQLLIWQAYEQLKAGHELTVNAKNHVKYPDKTYDIIGPKLNEAREILLSARSALARPWGVSQGAPAQFAADRIRASIRIIEIVMVTAL